MRIIGFNGPPHSGKDTLATAIEQLHDMSNRIEQDLPPTEWGYPEEIRRAALIMPCRLAAFALMGLGQYDDEVYARIKDVVNPHLGVTLRQFMIRIMEQHLKPIYGRGIAGQTLANQLRESVSLHMNEDLLLVTDIGFQEEVDILSDLVDEANFLLVKLERPGTDWSKDSRNYCAHSNAMIWKNDLTPEDGADAIMSHAYHEMGWEF